MEGQTTTSPLSSRRYFPLRAISVPQPGHLPLPPEGRRIAERVAGDEEEIGGSAFDDSASRCFSEQVSAADRRGRERLPRLEASFDERLDLPREVVRAQGPAAEIGARRDSHAGAVGELDALDRPLPAMCDPFLPFVADEPRQR